MHAYHNTQLFPKLVPRLAHPTIHANADDSRAMGSDNGSKEESFEPPPQTPGGQNVAKWIVGDKADGLPDVSPYAAPCLSRVFGLSPLSRFHDKSSS